MSDWLMSGIITAVISLVVLWGYVGFKLIEFKHSIGFLTTYCDSLREKIRTEKYRISTIEDSLKIPIVIQHSNGNREVVYFRLPTLVSMIMEEYQVNFQAEYILQHKALEVVKELSKEYKETADE